MKLLISLLFIFLNVNAVFDKKVKEETIRYILIEAPCKPNFDALPEYKEKVIITKVFKVKFENAVELVNAEKNLIVDFEVALEKAYPNSRNQVKDIMIYMLNTEKEAKEMFNRKKTQFKTLETGVIEIKIK